MEGFKKKVTSSKKHRKKANRAKRRRFLKPNTNAVGSKSCSDECKAWGCDIDLILKHGRKAKHAERPFLTEIILTPLIVSRPTTSQMAKNADPVALYHCGIHSIFTKSCDCMPELEKSSEPELESAPEDQQTYVKTIPSYTVVQKNEDSPSPPLSRRALPSRCHLKEKGFLVSRPTTSQMAKNEDPAALYHCGIHSIFTKSCDCMPELEKSSESELENTPGGQQTYLKTTQSYTVVQKKQDSRSPPLSCRALPSRCHLKGKGFLVSRPTTSQKAKNADPVALYHYFRKEWEHFRQQIPGENNHNRVTWQIRRSLLDPK